MFKNTDIIFVAVGLVAVFILAALDRAANRRRPMKRMDARLRQLAPWGPTILGLATAATLAVAALDRAALLPGRHVPDTALGTVVIAATFVIIPLLVIGLFVRVAAVALLAVTIIAMIWAPWRAALEFSIFLGISFFLLTWGRGRFSLGSFFSRFIAMEPGHVRFVATIVLRATLALSLASLSWPALLRGDKITALLGAAMAVLVAGKVLVRPLALFGAALVLLLVPDAISALPFFGAFAVLFILGKANY